MISPNRVDKDAAGCSTVVGRDRAGVDYWNRPRGADKGRVRSLRSVLSMVVNHRVDRMYSMLLGQLGSGDTLVEIGCAPGWMLARISRLRPDLKLSGIDYAPIGLDETKARLAHMGVDAPVALADMREWEAPLGFSAVLSAGLVEHYDEPVVAVRHHARIAGPGHLVIITVPNFATRMPRAFFEKTDPVLFAAHNLSVMYPPQLAGVLRQSGLEAVSSGYGGGALLRVPARGRGAKRSLLRCMAHVWNVASALLPSSLQPWHSFVWAVGSVPKPPDNQNSAGCSADMQRPG